jgi:hypothetical protein
MLFHLHQFSLKEILQLDHHHLPNLFLSLPFTLKVVMIVITVERISYFPVVSSFFQRLIVVFFPNQPTSYQSLLSFSFPFLLSLLWLLPFSSRPTFSFLLFTLFSYQVHSIYYCRLILCSRFFTLMLLHQF